jgi:hypothetical protein
MTVFVASHPHQRRRLTGVFDTVPVAEEDGLQLLTGENPPKPTNDATVGRLPETTDEQEG